MYLPKIHGESIYDEAKEITLYFHSNFNFGFQTIYISFKVKKHQKYTLNTKENLKIS